MSQLTAGLKEKVEKFLSGKKKLYINGEFVGGCDIVKEMFEKKELQKKLLEKKIPYNN